MKLLAGSWFGIPKLVVVGGGVAGWLWWRSRSSSSVSPLSPGGQGVPPRPLRPYRTTKRRTPPAHGYLTRKPGT